MNLILIQLLCWTNHRKKCIHSCRLCSSSVLKLTGEYIALSSYLEIIYRLGVLKVGHTATRLESHGLQ